MSDFCGNTRAHLWHGFHVTVETECTGKSRCGEQTHAPHTFTDTRAEWCRGVCGECPSRDLHSPGDHK